MDFQPGSLSHLRRQRVAVLGYGNQGRAHALNLKDAGLDPRIGLRRGASWDLAVADGLEPRPFDEAVDGATVVMFLLPDHVIPEVYQAVLPRLAAARYVGFAHGFAYHYKQIERLSNAAYFLAAPKGAGALLRRRYLDKQGLPGSWAVDNAAGVSEAEGVAADYCAAIGLHPLLRQSFAQETEGDLYGEQVVLCGGLIELLSIAYETLVDKGHAPDAAFLDCCYEAQRILDVLLLEGPKGLAERVSPTALFGGATRGPRVVGEQARAAAERAWNDIRSGKFLTEWQAEIAAGLPTVRERREQLTGGKLQEGFEAARPVMEETDVR